MPSYSYSSSSVSYSSTTNRDGQTTGQAYQRMSESTPQGTTVQTTRQNLGERPVTETRRYDATGRAIEATGAAGSDRRIQDVSGEEEESEADKLYRERMEDEYAKREGGA